MGQVSSVSYPARMERRSISSRGSAFLLPFLFIEDTSGDCIEYS